MNQYKKPKTVVRFTTKSVQNLLLAWRGIFLGLVKLHKVEWLGLNTIIK